MEAATAESEEDDEDDDEDLSDLDEGRHSLDPSDLMQKIFFARILVSYILRLRAGPQPHMYPWITRLVIHDICIHYSRL